MTNHSRNDDDMTAENEKITRLDLENKFRALQEDLQGRVESRKESLLAVAATVGTVVVVGAYLLGRRRGRRRSRRVEFRGF